MLDGGWEPPEDFDDYRVVRLLGRGSMGEVYLARDVVLDRAVAVKFMAPTIAGHSGARERFLDEARAIARLRHPNVVAIHRAGSIDGRLYLVTEYVEGKPLHKLGRPLDGTRALAIALGLARGLAAAHRRGVLHRDIKPANAILQDDGEVKLLDFGIARLLGGAPNPTGDGGGDGGEDDDALPTRFLRSRPGPQPGTPAYMAPESLRGAPASRRSDLYSLGALLFELASGRLPREGSALLAVMATVGAEIDRPTQPSPSLVSFAPGVDPRFAAIVDRCLRADPGERPASADEIVQALERLVPGRAAPPLPEGNPYRGLRTFEARHRGVFFGRAVEIRELLERLRAEPAVLITGDSGVGKSSLCRAGALPLVVEGHLEPARSWSVVSLVPGRRPVAALAAALAPLLAMDEEPLGAWLRSEPAALGRALRRALRADRGAVLFIDQLEELFTLAPTDEAVRVGELLGHLATPLDGVRLLLTIRGDFFTRLAALDGIGPEVSRALFLLRPMAPERVREAVVAPAAALNARFESDALVEELVVSSGHAAGGLPLLQFTLAALWEARDRGEGIIRDSSLAAIGGVEGALARHADEVLHGLGAEARREARRVLGRLVTLEGTRGRRTASELRLDLPAAREAVEALIRGRLIVAREAEGGEVGYEVAHEALLVGWKTLASWLAEDAEQRRLRHRVEVAATEWERLGRGREGRWSVRQLDEVVALSAADLGDHEQAFLAASRGAARRARRRRWMMAATAPLAIAAVYGGVEWRAHSKVVRSVAAHEGAARTELAKARAEEAQLRALRAAAFEGFDRATDRGQGEASGSGGTPIGGPSGATGGGTRIGGLPGNTGGGGTRSDDPAGTGSDGGAGGRERAEADWAESLAHERRADGAYGRAAQALEAALLLDVRRTDLRALLGNVTFDRLRLADTMHRRAQRDEMERRLENYDADGSRRASLRAAPRLVLTSDPSGARVTAEHWVDEDGALRLRDARDLGATPVEATLGGPGSYLITLRRDGRAEVRLPLLLAAGETHAEIVPLPAAAVVPAGFVFVPPGRFLFGSDEDEDVRRGFLEAPPLHEVRTGGYLIARTEVTFADWIAFLQDLPPDERARRRPEARIGEGGVALRELPGGRWQLDWESDGLVAHVLDNEPFHYRNRDRRAIQDWLRFPVAAISRADAEAYLAWLDRKGRVPGARLCSESEWERAARGADARRFPHGDRLDPDDADFDLTYGRQPGAYGPDEVGSHPASASPFGILDLAGNVGEWVRSARRFDEGAARGGGWYFDRISNRSNNRVSLASTTRDLRIGLRVCAQWSESGAPRPQ